MIAITHLRFQAGVLARSNGHNNITNYSKTPIYRGVWGQGNIRGKSGSAVNRGFVWIKLCMFSPIWGKEMAAVYRGLR